MGEWQDFFNGDLETVESGVPVIPPLPEIPTPTTPNDVVAICGQCGIGIYRVMGYVCQHSRCPTGLGGLVCRAGIFA